LLRDATAKAAARTCGCAAAAVAREQKQTLAVQTFTLHRLPRQGTLRVRPPVTLPLPPPSTRGKKRLAILALGILAAGLVGSVDVTSRDRVSGGAKSEKGVVVSRERRRSRRLLELLVHRVLDRTFRVPDSLLDLALEVLRRPFGLELGVACGFSNAFLDLAGGLVGKTGNLVAGASHLSHP
jgi:hypothetical protein